jgi:hypothetical protein
VLYRIRVSWLHVCFGVVVMVDALVIEEPVVFCSLG